VPALMSVRSFAQRRARCPPAGMPRGFTPDSARAAQARSLSSRRSNSAARRAAEAGDAEAAAGDAADSPAAMDADAPPDAPPVLLDDVLAGRAAGGVVVRVLGVFRSASRRLLFRASGGPVAHPRAHPPASPRRLRLARLFRQLGHPADARRRLHLRPRGDGRRGQGAAAAARARARASAPRRTHPPLRPPSPSTPTSRAPSRRGSSRRARGSG